MSKVFIKDIAKVINGSTPSTKRQDFYNGEISWITPKDLSNLKSKYIGKGAKSITNSGYKSCSTSLIPKGSILLSSRAPIGLLAIAENELCTNQGFKNLVLDKAKVKNEYLYYWLKTKVNYIGSLGTGTTFKEVSKSVIENLIIELPTLSVQTKIAKVLSDLDAKIELNNKINQELEAMAKLLYDYWFVQFDFPDANGRPYKTSGGNMVYNEELKREIPEGWKNGTLDDLGSIIGGSTPSKNEIDNFCINGMPWITPKDLSLNTGKKFITRGELDASEKGVKNASLKILPEGTVLLSSRAPIGYMVIARNDLTTNQGFKSFVPNKGYSIAYIYYSVHSNMKVIEQNASGSTFKEISGGVLKSIKVCLAGKNIREMFNKKVNTIFKRQNLLELENQKLTALRDWLLPMLMNGQVTVGEATLRQAQDDELGMVAEPQEKYKN